MSTLCTLLDADPGEEIGHAALNAVRHARATKGDVLLRHNDTIVSVSEGDTAEQVVRRWHDERRPKPRERTYIDGAGPWIAWPSDWSSIAVFAEEIDALRYALEHSMSNVEQMPWGEIR